jgi:hypothetical protein
MAFSVEGSPEKAIQVKSKVKKSMLIIFFDIKGFVHKVFVLAANNQSHILAVSSRQRTVSHFLFSREFLTKNMTVIPLLFFVSPIEDETERPPF